MKPQSPASVLLAMVLLALPGAAWAQHLALRGQVTFSDGTPAAGVSVTATAHSGGASQSVSTDASGGYVMHLAPDTYVVDVRFEEPGAISAQRLVTALHLNASTQLNLTLGDILLQGRIIDGNGQPVANARLYGESSVYLGWTKLSATSGADGRFQVRILPGTYSSLQIVPPEDSPYALTSLRSQGFFTSTSQDFVLRNGLELSGQVTFSDGTPAAGATVQASPSLSGPVQGATVNASGEYSLKLAPGTYEIRVRFEEPGFSGSQTLVTSQLLGTDTRLNLTVSDIQLHGRIVNSNGQPVAGALLYGYSSAGTLSPTADAEGRFQVRLLPGTYSSMKIVPASGSPYATTPLPTHTFSGTTTQEFALGSAIRLSGQVTFSDGTPAAGATVRASPNPAGPPQSATVDASGAYVLYLLPDTYDIRVLFEEPGSWGIQTFVTARPLSTDTPLNMTMSDIQLHGRIVNSHGQPVPQALLSGYGVLQNDSVSLSPTSDAEGRFQVRILPGTYSSLEIHPAPGSGYQRTPLQDETFFASLSQEFVTLDLDECQYNHGGCSENATCTNLPGSRTCTCKPGYSGDGITCTGAPGRVILNEILANEPGSATSGEFVELLNVGASPIDISGWSLWDATATRHTFAAGTVLAPGKALVVFGSASGVPSGLSNAVGASTGGLNLANSTDTVTVKNASGASIDTFTYSSSLASSDGVSMNRSPDGGEGAGFVLHNSLSSLSASAGKRVNGTAF